MADKLQPSFAAGVITPKAHGRVDLARFQTGLRTLENYNVIPHGGVSNRPGTKVVGYCLGYTDGSTKRSRLITFDYNSEQQYALEFGDLYFRIVKDGAFVTETAVTVTGLTQANPGVVTATAHGFANGDWVYITDVVGMTEVNDQTYQVANQAANSFELNDVDSNNISTSGFTAYSSGGTVARIKTVTTTYIEADLKRLKLDQSADLMTITHPSYPIRDVTRGALGHYDFSIADRSTTPGIVAPTGLDISQDWQVEIQGLVLTNSNHVRIEFDAAQNVASNFSVGQRIWVENVGGTVELNGKWFIISRIAVASPVYWMQIINTNGSDLDGTGMTAYTSGGRVYTEEKLKYRISSLDDKTGEESLSSADLVLDHAHDLAKQGIDLSFDPIAGSTPVRTAPVGGYNVYKNKNGIFGYIGSTPGSIKNDDYLTVTDITVATPGVVTTFAVHGFKNGDKIFFTESLGVTMVNGQTFIAANVASTTFELRNFLGQDVTTTGTFTSDLKTISDITQDASGGVVTTSVAHGYSKDDVIYIALVVGMTEVNDKFFGVGTVLSTTTFVLTDLNGKPIDTSGFTAHVPGGGPHIVKRAMCGPSPFWFQDDNIEAALNDVSPPNETREPFLLTDDFPGSVAFHEQRQLFARTNNGIQTIWMTQIGNLFNFNFSKPRKTGDAVTMTLPGLQANEIRHLLSQNELFIFTSGGVWVSSSGEASYVVENIRNRVQSKNGCADMPEPLLANDSILYVQSIGSSIWDVQFAFETNSFRSEDRSILAEHLFRGKTITDWAYTHEPARTLWVTVDDTTLVSMTFMPEHDLWGWSIHSTEGNIESVCAVSETDGDFLYLTSLRIINGTTRLFIERIQSRIVDDIRDAFFVDCGLSLDDPKVISGATKADPIVLTVTAHGFVEGDYVDVAGVGGMTGINDLRFRMSLIDADSFRLIDVNPVVGSEFEITDITQANPGVVTTETSHGMSNGDVILIENVTGMTEVNDTFFEVANVASNTFELQDLTSSDVNTSAYGAYVDDGRVIRMTTIDGTGYTAFASNGEVRKAVLAVTGLNHLAGHEVTILADGDVDPLQTVTAAGGITLADGRRASRIHVGLPYTCKFETLDITDPKGITSGLLKSIDRVTFNFYQTRGGWSGPDPSNLTELFQREDEDYDEPTNFQEGEKTITLESDWNSNGRVYLETTDPLPMTILSVAPEISLGGI
ncbi:hypothetical protein LCGC14_0414200 [marine sediment metagenome]|uniref:Ubiquitin-activating enzyme E1 FCCH domain-containing protein n=1 Tax=marine sediment metagenome TaxID=412755 RepID=A0A0F9SYW4_9ZZZZ